MAAPLKSEGYFCSLHLSACCKLCNFFFATLQWRKRVCTLRCRCLGVYAVIVCLPASRTSIRCKGMKTPQVIVAIVCLPTSGNPNGRVYALDTTRMMYRAIPAWDTAFWASSSYSWLRFQQGLVSSDGADLRAFKTSQSWLKQCEEYGKMLWETYRSPHQVMRRASKARQ